MTKTPEQLARDHGAGWSEQLTLDELRKAEWALWEQSRRDHQKSRCVACWWTGALLFCVLAWLAFGWLIVWVAG